MHCRTDEWFICSFSPESLNFRFALTLRLLPPEKAAELFLLTKMFPHIKMIFPISLQAAKKFVDGKKTMAASGHLGNTPFVDEVWK